MRLAPDITRVGPQSGPWPLHDTAAARVVEAEALAEHAPQDLMEHAGQAVARLALAFAPHAGRITVFAGPGNNGGDGLVAARHLRAAGKAVQVVLLGDAARLPADAAAALHKALADGVPVAPLPRDCGPSAAAAELVIDALLGLGARRPPEGDMAFAIALINRHAAPVLAVDLPTGLHPDTGTVLGAQAVHAQATLALLTLKPGCFTGAGRDHAGAVWLAPLGAPAGSPTAWLAGPPLAMARLHAAHKGSFGDVAVVGGAAGMAGAAWLAARAALAAGAGRVYAGLLDENAPGFDAMRPELMARHGWWRSPPAVLAASTVVCGCGGGAAVREALPALLTHAARLVLDADALNAIAAEPALNALLCARGARQRATVLTPHPLEAARLLGCSAAEVQHDRIAAALGLARAFGAAVVLKGSGSVIAAPGAMPRINPTGNAALATAGTGDVLAGWLGGLWAQWPTTAGVEVATAAAWQHGRAADHFIATGSSGPLRAADLVEAMARLSAP